MLDSDFPKADLDEKDDFVLGLAASGLLEETSTAVKKAKIHAKRKTGQLIAVIQDISLATEEPNADQDN